MFRQQHEYAIGIHKFSQVRNYSKSVTIAIKGNTQVGLVGDDAFCQGLQVLGNSRVGMVIGEIAVNLAIEWQHVTTESLKQPGSYYRRNSIAAVYNQA